ncbi:MAG: chorismate mutase [Rhodospirillaceae bacterium]
MVRAKAKAKTKTSKPAGRRTKSAAAIKGPAHYKSLTALRGAIDAMDDVLLPLLARRLKLVASAARFKPSVAGVVIHARVEEIVVRVRTAAVKLGVNPDCFEDVYRHLIDAYTREEQRNWKTLHR